MTPPPLQHTFNFYLGTDVCFKLAVSETMKE